MKDCIFCEIASGARPADIVHETPAAIAFLDRFPSARGHTLVVPRIHAETLLDLDDAAVGGLFLAVKSVQAKIQAALAPIGFHVGWNHGRAAGQHVLHLHVHVLPRRAGGRGIQLLGEGGERGDLAQTAALVRAASS